MKAPNRIWVARLECNMPPDSLTQLFCPEHALNTVNVEAGGVQGYINLRGFGLSGPSMEAADVACASYKVARKRLPPGAVKDELARLTADFMTRNRGVLPTKEEAKQLKDTAQDVVSSRTPFSISYYPVYLLRDIITPNVVWVVVGDAPSNLVRHLVSQLCCAMNSDSVPDTTDHLAARLVYGSAVKLLDVATGGADSIDLGEQGIWAYTGHNSVWTSKERKVRLNTGHCAWTFEHIREAVGKDAACTQVEVSISQGNTLTVGLDGTLRLTDIALGKDMWALDAQDEGEATSRAYLLRDWLLPVVEQYMATREGVGLVGEHA